MVRAWSRAATTAMAARRPAMMALKWVASAGIGVYGQGGVSAECAVVTTMGGDAVPSGTASYGWLFI